MGGRAFDENFTTNLPLYLETLEAEGRQRDDQLVLCGFQGRTGSPTNRSPTPNGCAIHGGARERWAAAGADGAIVLARDTADVDALVEAAGRW